jgi:hypothetical protein
MNTSSSIPPNNPLTKHSLVIHERDSPPNDPITTNAQV